MAKWYDENIGRQYQPSKSAPEGWVQKAIRKSRAFGLGRIFVVGKGIAPKAMPRQPLAAINRLVARFHPPTAEIILIQPLVFYKKALAKGAGGTTLLGIPFSTRELLERSGKKGTARTVPLENPDLLLFYGQLKEAKKLGAKTVTVHGHYADEKKQPFRGMYDRIAELSHPFEPDRLRYSLRAVFHRKQ
jgi:hypothetical protein